MYRNQNYERSYENYEFSESDRIGNGGFAVVYKGVRREDRETVAIKKITKNRVLGEKELKNMKDLANVSDSEKYLVRLEGYFYHRSHLHLVMPYYELGCFRDFMRINDRFSEATIARILINLVCAVICLHSKRIVHRDLTLGNVLVTSAFGDDVHVLVSDFGLTKQMEGEQLQTVVGTLGYMHPGILTGHGYGKKVDIYSLGGILYALLTGNDPKYDQDEMLKEARKFASSNAVDLLRKMLDTRRPIRLTDILFHQFMKKNAILSSQSTIMESNLNKKLINKQPCLHRTIEDGKCVICLKIVRESDVQRRRSRSRSKSSLGGSRQTLEKDEDVQSWPLSKFDHMAPFGMICQKGGRIILKGKKLIFENVDGQYVDYVVEIEQIIRKSGLIHQTMSLFKPTSQKCVIPTDEKQMNPVPYDDQFFDTFTISKMPSEIAKCYKLIAWSLNNLKGRVARVDFINIFGVKRLNAKLMYNGDFRLIFSNDKIYKRSPGEKEIIDIKEKGRMNAEDASIFEKAEIALKKYEEACVYSHGEDHPPHKIQIPSFHDDVNRRVVAETNHIQM